MRRRPLSALAALGASALILSACTPAPTERGESGSGGTAAEAAPVVTVANEALGEGAAAAGSTAESASAEAESADSAASATEPADASGTETAEDSGDMTIAAGEPLELTVEGGEFAEVELIDLDHETVPVDTGSLGAADAEAASDAPSASAEHSDAEAAEQGEDSSAAAQAGGTVDAETPDAADEESPANGEATSEAPAGGSSTDWASSADLVTGASYQWTATTVAPDGSEHTSTGTVTTPETTAVEELTAKTVISDGETVGIGAPVIVMFNSTIPESARDDIEARLSVEVTDEDGEPVEVEGSWGWLYDTDGISRVHYRPKEFWPAHVDVSVNLPLEGVEYSDRWYGKEDVALDFEVGRDQRVTADAQTHRMKIERDGEEIVDWPTSLGSPQAPSYNGTHVVMSKHAHYVMTSEQWNYETPTNWAVRIHNNGEFIHGAPWSAGSQGRANVSHGCINLTDERAKEYYDMALYGDPVEITGSSVDLSTEHSDISDWVYDWDEWQELSALS
ncbi:L,D-transpeptidase [Brevibacterium album]|uniref:L,D-transpeptidase n=1 Tax=Brevibacterium album TaxID=417948 RepID=UPI0003F878AB|nr:L,D-transpeptidase [Brevibacterium album]